MRKPVTELSSKQIYSSSVTPELMYYSTAFTGFPTRFLLHLKRWRAKILARKGLQNFRAIRTEEINYYTPLHLHCDPVIDIQTGKFENERRSIMIIFILKKQTYFPGQIEAHGHFNHSLGPIIFYMGYCNSSILPGLLAFTLILLQSTLTWQPK